MGTHPIFESDFDCLTDLERTFNAMADTGVQIKKKRTFKKYTYRGVDLDQLLAIKSENLIELLGCRARRHFNRGIKRREENFLKRLRKVKKAMTGEIGEKPNRGQARDDQPLHWRVLNDLQASSSQSPRYWCHSLISLHPTQINWEKRDILCTMFPFCQ